MKRILPLTLALALLVTGCGGQGVPSGGTPDPGPTSPAPDGPDAVSPTPSGVSAPPIDLSAFGLAQAVYPEFPAYPEPPAEGDADWDAYFNAESDYYRAVNELRGGVDPAVVRGNQALLDFAAKSTPLALAGHEGENAIYSPLSLWSALAMEARCANGNSRQQVLDALGVSGVDALRELVRQMWLALYTNDGRDALVLSNSIWLNGAAQGHYAQDTLDTLAKDYFSGVYSVPMGTEEADRAVTDWISQQTNGLIGGDEPVVKTDELTLALLVSSLYYRAGWSAEFYEGNTYEDTFTAANGQESRVDFMHKSPHGLFLLREGYQAAYLPTRLGEMVFVLPDEGITPESLLEDPDFLNGLKFVDGRREHADPTAAQWGEVQWSVPKFDVDSNLDLMEALKKLGITDLLDPDMADLSNLTDIPAYLSKALQLARVKVDEEGAEAAAVTILAEPGAAPETEPPEVEVCVMDLDRPFLFVIRSWDLPLFVGVVNQVSG